MSDRFRDLEMTARPGRRNAVLLATVSSFEGIIAPTSGELRQFRDLFIPLFATADIEAKRTAAAALSRHPNVPREVTAVIVSEPLDVAAPYLVHATCLDADDLIAILRHRPDLARAIARRNALPAAVLEHLHATGDEGLRRTLTLRGFIAPQENADRETSERPEISEREEQLRERLRQMAHGPDWPDQIRPLPIRLAGETEERMLQHARAGEVDYFATVLADALQASFALAERIMLDVSGRQLAETMVALGMRYPNITVVLEALFPHLARQIGGERASLSLLHDCAYGECLSRIEAWRRADAGDRRSAPHEPHMAENGTRSRGNPGAASRTNQTGKTAGHNIRRA